MSESISLKLLEKYNVPGPRYTSYPTYPSWKGIIPDRWFSHFKSSLHEDKTLSIYIHVPFCEILCAFCGCTKEITKDYSKASPYIEALHKEFKFYEEMLPEGVKVSEIHFGGGSPSWLKPSELKLLLEPILNSKKLIFDPNFLEQSIEMDPRTTTEEHFKELKKLGFNRISMGIQDTNDTVLKAIRREQPLSLVTNVVNNLKNNGIELFNMDLIYGLPFQTVETFTQTINDILVFRPTRIALYSYAHVPSLKPAQKILEKSGLPTAKEKMMIQESARKQLVENGYVEIGMDHFALKSDTLYQSYAKGELHRNFMGYTVQKSKVLLGLGPSSLSDSWTAFSQNAKEYKTWREKVLADGHAIIHGHELKTEDLSRRQNILDLMCHFETKISFSQLSDFQNNLLKTLSDDELIVLKDDQIKVTENGKQFIRNICMTLDESFNKGENKNIFSQTV